MYRTVRSLPAVKSNQGLAAEKKKEAARTLAPNLFLEETETQDKLGEGLNKQRMKEIRTVNANSTHLDPLAQLPPPRSSPSPSLAQIPVT